MSENTIDRLHKKIANLIASLCTILTVLIFMDVLLRYLFNLSYSFITELEWYIFSAIFLMGLSYTFKNDKHVRVDVFYSNFSENTKAIVNKLGIIIFLIPFCLIVIWYSGKFTYNSWLIQESSPEAGGLKYRFLVKALIPMGYILLLIQALINLFQSKVENK